MVYNRCGLFKFATEAASIIRIISYKVIVMERKKSFWSRMDKAQKKRLVVSLVVLVILAVAAYKLYFPSDPLEELKRTETVQLVPLAQETIDEALKSIEENDMKKLASMMRMKDSIAFKMNYTSGIFRKELASFTPAKVVGEPKRLVHSSWDNMFVRLHSEPRNEDYWISLVRIGDSYMISEILPTSVCKEF